MISICAGINSLMCGESTQFGIKPFSTTERNMLEPSAVFLFVTLI